MQNELEAIPIRKIFNPHQGEQLKVLYQPAIRLVLQRPWYFYWISNAEREKLKLLRTRSRN